jgi:hypothetical protein
MALTGQLSDMSLAELIEFFCNQRKTGRLKIDYQRGHSVFFIKDGELVDARVGGLSGVDAVYFSLTLPNAAFDFSPDVQATRRTINDPWTQVVLEGLRRLDEGNSPSESDAFGGWSPSDADLVTMLNQVENLNAAESHKDAKPVEVSSDEPFSMMTGSASGGASKKKWMVMGVAASVVLACAVAAVPLMGGSSKPEAAAASAQPAQPAPVAPEANPVDAAASPEAAPAESPDAGVAEAAARREALDRERRERERRERKAQEAAANKDDAALDATGKPVAPTPAVASGPKSVRVTVVYDESGRVTQASVAGVTPGAEAYGGTAVRIARGRRFPAGKAGATVVTIPVN